MLLRTRAIVLRSLPQGEADLIVTYITEDYGIMKGFAKSPRKTGSRFGSSLEPFSFVRVSLFGREHSTIFRITGSDIIEPFEEIRSDLQRVSYLAPAINLTERLLVEGEPEKEIFYLLLMTLRYIRAVGLEEAFLLSLAYAVKLLNHQGFSPRLDHCTGCQRDTATYHIAHGSLLCSECAGRYHEGSELKGLSDGARSLYRALLNWDLRGIVRIKVSKQLLGELIQLLEDHIRYHVIQRGSPPLFRTLQVRAFQEV